MEERELPLVSWKQNRLPVWRDDPSVATDARMISAIQTSELLTEPERQEVLEKLQEIGNLRV